MNSRLLGRIRCHESDRGSDQWSIPNAQFSSEVDVGLRNVPPMQDKIALSDQLVLQAGSHTCGGFSFRIRIENWELNIRQILPSLHSAKLILREPLARVLFSTDYINSATRSRANSLEIPRGRRAIGPPSRTGSAWSNDGRSVL